LTAFRQVKQTVTLPFVVSQSVTCNSETCTNYRPMPAEDVKIEIPSTSNREPTTVGILSPVRRISSPPVKEYEEVTSAIPI
jgi:hypothetical protein